MNDRPRYREDSPMYRAASRLKRGNLPYELAKLEVGQALLKEVEERSEYRRLADKTAMAVKGAKPLEGRQFRCALYHCENMSDPEDTILVARIERLADKEKETSDAAGSQ